MVNFSGTDTIPVLSSAKHYYGSENIGFSVPASEHSVMSAGVIDIANRLERGEMDDLIKEYYSYNL
jgi:hypothetical protein